MFRQITWQSNFLSFALAFLAFFWPKFKAQLSNHWFIISASLLMTSSIIFTFAFMPIFLNLNLFRHSSKTPLPLVLFWNIWNHHITPISFLNLLAYRHRKEKNKLNLSRQEVLFRYRVYWLINILLNIYFSFDSSQALPYGPAANWNWARTDGLIGGNSEDGDSPINYSVKLSFFFFFLVLFVSFISLRVFWFFFESRWREEREKRGKVWSLTRFC